MKSLLLGALTFAALMTHAFAGELDLPAHNYKCIADTLEAYNSDIYYNLSVDEIDELLNHPETDARSWKAIEVARECDAK